VYTSAILLVFCGHLQMTAQVNSQQGQNEPENQTRFLHIYSLPHVFVYYAEFGK